MAFEESNMIMPVSPMYGNNGGFGNGFGGDWSAWLILFLFAMMFNGGWGGMGGFGGGLGYDFPWLLNGQNNTDSLISNGFQNSQLSNQLNGIHSAVTSGFGDVQTALCGGFAGVNATVNGAQNAIAQQLYTNQIADLERSFAAQTASTNGFYGVQNQLCNGFNNTTAGLADVKYSIATEECATRNTDTQNTQSILNALNNGVQSIKDQLYSDKMDAKNDEIAQLRQEVLFARGQSSQIGQNETIINGVYNRLNECPVGTVPVYGKQPIFNCNNGCGCGCGA